MRTVVHLSDLHFGRVDAATLEPLAAFIADVRADLVVISGDLTQRARTSQFLEARRFLEGIAAPRLVVPGNHDIPLNPVRRFSRPLAKFRHHICSDLAPFFHDDEIAVAGINTARALTTKYGRINPQQLQHLKHQFQAAKPDVTRLVVTHHPFDLPADYDEHRQLVGRAGAAMAALAANRVELLLAGHLHLAHTSFSTVRYPIAGHSALIVLAGTATSTRGRGEANSFNVLRVAADELAIERIVWDPEKQKFLPGSVVQYQRMAGDLKIKKKAASPTPRIPETPSRKRRD